MNVFGIGLPEMALIFVVALLIFGPKKLPEVGRSLGKAIRGFQQASSEFQNEFEKEATQLQEAVKTTAKLETNEIQAAQLPQDTTSSAQKS
ncbi:Sec-independent protein translocase TatA [Scytonema sp. HK-05]|uniref:TatA/E family twin arginine-targeting protein translocase n=1 Tax=Scytonema sp. HK-05 TaxID=1137095 RepID=UPI000935D80F|nr:TatA/E family twin arginine-targeting protein translocase [Scytonema sp. HK-05]OKH57905.1 Sec-independent protein translocase TatA [Scytonema sp. HK-05]BAY44031.1 Sec-independent protein translocase TatA [Scytonema sp. HK-05]